MPTFSISDSGLSIQREGPPRSPDDVAARRRAVVQALEILHPVVRPLALEITPEAPGWDFATIEALVTAARTSERDPIIDRMPSRAVPMLELDGGRWLVGPIDAPGYRLQPPIRLTWRQQWGELSLTIQALWSLWWQTGSPEHTGAARHGDARRRGPARCGGGVPRDSQLPARDGP